MTAKARTADLAIKLLAEEPEGLGYSIYGCMTLSDFRVGHHPIDDVCRGDLHHTRISRNYPDHLSGMLRSVPRRIEHQLHAVSANASATKPAKLLAVLLAEKGKQLTTAA